MSAESADSARRMDAAAEGERPRPATAGSMQPPTPILGRQSGGGRRDPKPLPPRCHSVLDYLAARSPSRAMFAGSRLGEMEPTGSGDLLEKLTRKKGPEVDGPVTATSIQYRTTMSDLGRFMLKKKQMTPEEAEAFLAHNKRAPLRPPLTRWEQADQRQEIINDVALGLPSEDAPGGSWVLRPGAMPASRATHKDADKISPIAVLTKERLKLLSNLRWQLATWKILTHLDLRSFFQQRDPNPSLYLPMGSFLEILRNWQFEVTSERHAQLEQMFMSKELPGHVNYEYFITHLMRATADLDRQILDNRHQSRTIGGAELKTRMRTSSIFNDLNSLRPKSKSGRFHTYSDMRDSMERPLVIAPGNQKIRGMYQFCSEREETFLHKYRDRDPVRGGVFKPGDPEDTVSGQSKPKLLAGGKQANDAESSFEATCSDPAASVAIENAEANRTIVPPMSHPPRARSPQRVDFTIDGHAERVADAPVARRESPNKAAASLAWKELQSPNNVEDMFCSHVSDTNDFRYYDNKVERMYQHSSDAKQPATRLTPAQAEEVRLAASVAESVPPKSLLRHPPRKFQAKFFDQGTEPSSITQIPPKSKPGNNGSNEEKYVVGRAQNKNLQQLRPPAWDVTFRYAAHGAKDILACPDKQGLNSSKHWAPSNECNMDIPGGIAARVELKEMLEQNQKVNASKKQTNWTYAHGEAVSPKTWTTTLGDQMTFKSRLRTPKRHVLEAGELREASWSVQERNMVHLGKYDHSLVGLRRPEPLAKGNP